MIIIIIHLKYLHQLGIINFTCLIDHALFQTFKTILTRLLKKHQTSANNHPVQIYGNRIKNRIVFKRTTGFKWELLSPETMKLLGSAK